LRDFLAPEIQKLFKNLQTQCLQRARSLLAQVAAFAAFIGMDLQADADLLWIAEDAILHPLPPGAASVMCDAVSEMLRRPQELRCFTACGEAKRAKFMHGG
jgi:hypothetical protein